MRAVRVLGYSEFLVSSRAVGCLVKLDSGNDESRDEKDIYLASARSRTHLLAGDIFGTRKNAVRTKTAMLRTAQALFRLTGSDAVSAPHLRVDINSRQIYNAQRRSSLSNISEERTFKKERSCTECGVTKCKKRGLTVFGVE